MYTSTQWQDYQLAHCTWLKSELLLLPKGLAEHLAPGYQHCRNKNQHDLERLPELSRGLATFLRWHLLTRITRQPLEARRHTRAKQNRNNHSQVLNFFQNLYTSCRSNLIHFLRLFDLCPRIFLSLSSCSLHFPRLIFHLLSQPYLFINSFYHTFFLVPRFLCLFSYGIDYDNHNLLSPRKSDSFFEHTWNLT